MTDQTLNDNHRGTATESGRLQGIVLAAAVLLGLAIAWVDSRPGWDDDGVTAFALLITSGCLGAIAPRRPWRWALAIGIWIPLCLFVRTPTLGALAGGCVIVAFPMAGAYAGMLLRRTLSAR